MSSVKEPVEEKKQTETQAKQFKSLEEDDEFEDFPQEDWDHKDTLGAEDQEHLWEESWDDDDNDDDFTQRLKAELKKHEKPAAN